MQMKIAEQRRSEPSDGRWLCPCWAVCPDRDREWLAIQRGIDDMNAGRVQDFDEFDREFREKNGISLDV